MPPKSIPFDRSACTYIVYQYLKSQNWYSVDHHEFAHIIWGDLKNSWKKSRIPIQKVQTQVWLNYSMTLLQKGC